ncbi:MAG: MarR family transcriptional regulator [Desulfobacterales bacterium]
MRYLITEGCYWSVIELGISKADLARRFGITLSAVSYAVKRGEEIAKEGGYLIED